MDKGQHVSVLERVKVEAEDHLAHFPSERRGTILLGRWPVSTGRGMVERIRLFGWREAKSSQINLGRAQVTPRWRMRPTENRPTR